jgi:hypothetical protein
MFKVPDSEEPGVLADWVEANCLFEEQALISDATLKRALEEQGIAEPEEEIIPDIRRNVELRRAWGGGYYPLLVELSGFRRAYQWDKNPAYAFQLLLALLAQYGYSPARRRTRINPTKLFEQLVTIALRSYLRGEAINVGFPREPKIRSFPKCLKHLCKELGEKLGGELYNKTKDDYVDVVAWHSFGDWRSGQVIVLAGCTISKNWQERVNEIVTGRSLWNQYINWAVPPVTAFAFPYVCAGDNLWRRLSVMGGILLDRLRIAAMFACNETPRDKRLHEQIISWCRSQLRYF